MVEIATIKPGVFYCDHDPNCTDSFKLPALVGEMIYKDKTLFLLVGNHQRNEEVEVIKRGKGWRVCRVK